MLRIFTLVFLLLFCLLAQSQMGYLFVKKGFHKKKTYVEEDRIMLQLQNGTICKGLITLLENDTIFVNGKPIPVEDVQAVIIRTKRKRPFNIGAKELLLITGGATLTTAGLTLSNQAKFKEALEAGLVIGFGPLLVQYLSSKVSFARRQYRMGKKFRLQVLDFHLPPKRGF